MQVQHCMYLHIYVPYLLSDFIPLCSTKTWFSVQNCITPLVGRHQFSHKKQILVGNLFHYLAKRFYIKQCWEPLLTAKIKWTLIDNENLLHSLPLILIVQFSCLPNKLGLLFSWKSAEKSKLFHKIFILKKCKKWWIRSWSILKGCLFYLY